MRFEGGFQGRCNKLVDGCYSFWQAGVLPLLHRALFKEGEDALLNKNVTHFSINDFSFSSFSVWII